MLLKQALKERICRFNTMPNYPVQNLVAWVESEGLTAEEVLDTLYLVRRQLWVESEALTRKGGTPVSPVVIEQHRFWCVHCDQVVNFYEALVYHPESKAQSERLYQLSDPSR